MKQTKGKCVFEGKEENGESVTEFINKEKRRERKIRDENWKREKGKGGRGKKG